LLRMAKFVILHFKFDLVHPQLVEYAPTSAGGTLSNAPAFSAEFLQPFGAGPQFYLITWLSASRSIFFWHRLPPIYCDC